MAFKNRVLWRIFGPKREEVMGGWRKLHNEELHDLYSLPRIIRMVEKEAMGKTCTINGEKRDVYRFLVGKPEGKIILG
jgi:hypothetical protein